jgi:DNA-directed RNA polymerase alpha subunit
MNYKRRRVQKMTYTYADYMKEQEQKRERNKNIAEHFGLSIQTALILKRHNFNDIEELEGVSEESLRKMYNIGDMRIKEIKDELERRGIAHNIGEFKPKQLYCRDCKKKISVKFKFCPYCGKEMQK